MKRIIIVLFSVAVFAVRGTHAAPLVFQGADGPGKGKHIVFLAGDHEYRSEETLPAMARLLAKHHGFKCTVLFNIDPATGEIVAGNSNMPGLEALASADLAVVFLRFQAFPPEQMKHFDAYLKRGGPVVGLRTATHAFNGSKEPYAKYNYNAKEPGYELGFGHQVLGQTWVGHYGQNHRQSTRIMIAPDKASHPILRGVKDVWVQVGGYVGKPTDGEILTMAQPLNGMTPDSPADASKPPQPSEWTRTHKSANGKAGRVFTTLYGTSEDITNEGYRRLVLNGIFWAVGLESAIKPDLNIAFVGPFKPNTYNGGSYARGIKPEMYAGFESQIPANNNTKNPNPPAKKNEGKKASPKKADTKPADAKPAAVSLAKDGLLLFYGGGMVERLLESGHFEAHLQLAHPDLRLRVRSLAWTGDEVGHRLRPEGYVEHLKNLLTNWSANVVVLGYGLNESFAGRAGLAEFRAQYETCLREITSLHPKAKLVLLSPLAVPSDATRNADLALYSAAIADLAHNRGALFVDLFATSRAAHEKSAVPLTTQGIHLTEAGGQELGRALARALVGESAMARVPTWRVADVAKAAAQKSRHVADLVRPKNGVVYYGVRKRPEEYAAEMPRYHQLVAQAEQILRDLVSKPTTHFADFPAPSLPPMPEGKSKIDRFGGGVVKSPAEQQQEFKVADGYALNLFASEVDFPELKAPVQIAFDARGRLWVVTMPSFPHTVPGAPPRDKILILEDTNRDGKADKSTVFAEGFDALDGVAFHERGVIVSAQPRLLLLQDRDGDGRADSQTELLRGVDVTDSHHGGMVATDPLGHVIFCDGVFHRSQFETPFGVVRGIDSTTYRLDPASGRITAEWQSMTPNPWKVAFDRTGNIFQRYGGGHLLDALPLTWTPFGAYHPYGHGTVVNHGKGSALSVVSSPNFPAEYQQGVISATLLGSYFVSLSKAKADGGPVIGTDRLDLISSTNAAFRPVDSEFGFDGALYVSDFSSRIIGHAQHPMRDPQWNHEKGRIWRIVHTGRPVATDWPDIEGAPMPQLLVLLAHPQNIVRHHARIRLRGLGGAAVSALDTWTAALNRTQPAFGQSALEALWVLHAHGEVRPALLDELLRSPDPLLRTAAVQLMRFQAERLPEALQWLTRAAQDEHPRVRMAVVGVIAHLRQRQPQFEQALTRLNATEPPVRQMVADLKLGTKPLRGRSIPVLKVAPETKVNHWLLLGETSLADPAPTKTKKGKAVPNQTKTYRTFVEAEAAQSVRLSVKHGYLDISANGVQLLTADSQWSSEQQVQVDLQRGLNSIEVAFRRTGPAMPPVFLYDLLGQPLAKARLAKNDAELKTFAATWDKAHAADANALRVQAVPNLMQFAPRELRAKPGQPVRILFDNPDSMPHNFVLVAPGADEEIGRLADEMATRPDALAKHYLPDSKKVLHATALVNPNGRAELNFTAPTQSGRYPYLCTFPGHWRIMRGVLLVADNVEEFLAKNPEPTVKLTEWKLADFADDLKRVGAHRNFARGQQMFTALACAQCHQLGKEGVAFGPSLSDVVKKYKGDAKAVLQEILEPSKTIEDKYRNVTLELGDENSLSGLVFAEDATSVTLQTGPAANQIQKISKPTIKSRKVSALSLMPAALLNSLDKEQILDLLAFILAEGKADHAAFKHGH